MLTPATYIRYAELKRITREANTEMEILKERLVAELEDLGGKDQTTEYGTFRFQSSTRWKYPKDIEDKIDNMHIDAQLSGKAEQIVTKALYFDPIKE